MPSIANVFHAFTVAGLPDELILQELHGTEALSQLFQFQVLVATDAPLAFDDVAGKDATLRLQVEETDEPRYVHGIVSRIEHAETTAHAHGYWLTVVPKVYRLLHRADARIFQEKTAPDVIKAVLEGAGLAAGEDFRLTLNATYPAREYTVQYRETDWDFVCRLMEDEGIFFFFQHAEDKSLLVLGDDKNVHEDIAGDSTLVFRPPQGALGIVERGTHVSRFTLAREIRPGKVTLRDYNFEKPSLSLESDKLADVEDTYEIYDYPGVYVDPAVGKERAQKRIEELRSQRTAGDGDGSATRFVAGATFTLAEHPVEAHNARYLITRVEHRARLPVMEDDGSERFDPYSNRFEVVPADAVTRPPRVTKKPLIHGVQTAIVVGPAGEEIHTDKHGRVKVQFFWDRLGKKDDKSSCWIRVAQMWAGPAYGGMYIPRVGHEVVITFLEGDPDRPLIVGSVYHGTNVPPYALPGEKTKSTIKTNTSLGGDGFNEIRFEDKKGSEEIYVHGQKDWNIVIENDKAQKIGHDETLEVENDRTRHVKHDQKLTVDHDETNEIKHDRQTTVKNDETLLVEHDRKVTVNNDHTETVQGNQTISVTKDQKETVSGLQEVTISKTQKLTVGEDVTHTLNGALTLAVAADRTEDVTGDDKLTVGKGMTVTVTKAHAVSAESSAHAVTKTHELKADQQVDIKVGQATVTIKSDGTIEIAGAKMSVKCSSGDVKVEGVNVEVKAQANVKIEGNGQVTVKGNGPVQVSGSSMVKIGGSMVGIG